MKFDRIDLIERVKNEIERREAEARAENDKAAEVRNQRRMAYVRDVNPLWAQLADRIRLRVRTDQPLILADIPSDLVDRSWGRSNERTVVTVTLWDDREPALHKAHTDDLHTLVALLGSTDVPEVTLATLDRLGIKINQVFRKS